MPIKPVRACACVKIFLINSLGVSHSGVSSTGDVSYSGVSLENELLEYEEYANSNKICHKYLTIPL